MNDTNWFNRLITPPSPNEDDERASYIRSLAIRDAFIAVILVLLLLPAAFQFPSLRPFSSLGLALVPMLAIFIGAITYITSDALHGGWSWSKQRWQALLALLIVVPILATVALLQDTILAPEFHLEVLLPILLVLAILLAIVLLSLCRDRSTEDRSNQTRGIQTLVGRGLISFAIVVFLIYFTLQGRQTGIAALARLRLTEAILLFVLGLLGALLAFARIRNVPLPPILQGSPNISSERRVQGNKRFLVMSIFVLIISMFFLIQALQMS